MKISFVTTVFNEEKTINKLLDSIKKQTVYPDEVIIVDGGSTDNTLSVISNFQFPISNKNVKIINKEGNRSVGRNEAIRNSKGEVIAVSDAGCVLDRSWIKNIKKPFENKGVDIVGGFYKPITTSIFEKCLATYTCTMPDRVNPKTFLPSSRSVAFRKEVWQKVRGYPEELDTCEDLVFDKKLKNAGLKFAFAKSAIVYWPQRKNIFQAFGQFFNYATGDGRAFYIRPQTPVLFIRYLFGFILIAVYILTKSNVLLSIIYYLLSVYIAWSIYKNYKYVKHLAAFIYLPLLQLTSDIAVIFGTFLGLIHRSEK